MAIKEDYSKRLNRVFKFIAENLDQDLSLNVIAKEAYFSPFHFHRLFKTITDETLNDFINRLRVEKAASDLLHKNESITEVAIRNGFNSNSSFTRSFKKYFNVNPTEFLKQHPNRFSKIRQLNSKNGQAYPDTEKYICAINNIKQWFTMNAQIEVKELPQMNLAYTSNIGVQGMEQAFQKIMKWATPKGLMNENTKMLTIYHDSFQVTDADKVRMSACIELNTPVEVDGEMSKTFIPKGKYIVGRYELGLNDFEKAWTGQFIWMNENGYKKANKDPFEIYYNDYRTHPENKFIVDICIPVE